MSTTAAQLHTIATPAALAKTRGGGMVWTGRVISGIISLFLLMDGGLRMIGFAPYVEGTVQVGFAVHLAPWIGLALFASTLLYLIPRTSILGAILVTGYLGGAVATQVRLEDPWFLFPVLFGALTWGGLYLRDAQLRALLPLRR